MPQTQTELKFIATASRRFRFLGLALRAIIVSLVLTGAAQADQVNRRILAIYDSGFEAVPDATLVHAWAEMPLNHLGYIIDYWDAARTLPNPVTAAQYSAVLTWFTYEVAKPAEYLSWARHMVNNHVPFIVFGQIGVPATSQNLASANQIFRPMGIAHTSNFIEATNGTRIVRSDPSVIGFERQLENILPSYPVIQRLTPAADIALEVEAPARERRVRSALVTAGPGGAFVLGAFAINVDPVLGRSQWLVNPFAIFAKVLNTAPFPIPDTTTVSGRRLYFSNIDGDGWNDSVEMDRYNNPPVLAADVVERELIAPYPDLPVTVGLISSDLDPAYGKGEEATEAARRIFALPQVEVASHSATVPLVWASYEFQSRAEGERAAASAPISASGAESWLFGMTEAVGITKAVSETEKKRARFVSDSHGLPRVYLRDPFSLNTEINDAARLATELAPSDKRARLFTWTGDAKPFEKAIRATRLAGLRNINGGGARYDSMFPSLSYVTPIARQVGGERQIYAVDASDSSYADSANAGLGGFARLSETLEATEEPRRLKGVNLYYHVYSAKKQASLSALKRHLDWARAARLAPITATDYASIADGFFTARIEKSGPMKWTISDRDGLQTLRLDRAGAVSVDVPESRGVVGSTVYQGSLYVALDSSVADAVLALRSAEEGIAISSAGALAQLEQSSWQVLDLRRTGCGFSFAAQGFGAGQFEWKDLVRGAYRVEATGRAGTVWQTTASADHEGRLLFEIPDHGIEPVSVLVSCTPKLEERP
jgi:polysaccharide biosynthesis protein PelA